MTTMPSLPPPRSGGSGVGVTPGVDFGAAGEGWLRFCYANSEAALEGALTRLARVLPELT